MNRILPMTACFVFAVASMMTACAGASDEGAVESEQEAIKWQFQKGLWGDSGSTWTFDRSESSSAPTDHAEYLVMGTPTSKLARIVRTGEWAATPPLFC